MCGDDVIAVGVVFQAVLMPVVAFGVEALKVASFCEGRRGLQFLDKERLRLEIRGPFSGASSQLDIGSTDLQTIAATGICFHQLERKCLLRFFPTEPRVNKRF